LSGGYLFVSLFIWLFICRSLNDNDERVIKYCELMGAKWSHGLFQGIILAYAKKDEQTS
jgi:hypothetical protein